MPRYLTVVALLFSVLQVSGRTLLTMGVADVERGTGVSSATATLVQTTVESELARTDRIQIIERSRLEDVLEEVAFQQAGVTRSETAVTLGEHQNVQMLVFAEVTRAYPDHLLSFKVVDVASNRVVRVDEVKVGAKPDEIEAGARLLASRLAGSAFGLTRVEMVLHPGGTFIMGSDTGMADERPPHTVTLAAFMLDRTEVSRGAYNLYLESRGDQLKGTQPGDLPVRNVSWSDAEGYCRSLGQRLPTEAEWEYAARGSEGRTYPWGEEPPSSALARFGGHERTPLAVDDVARGATRRGVLQMAGNVAEWVGDWWDNDYYATAPNENPTGPGHGDFKVVRGGGWAQDAFGLRAAARAYHNRDKGAAYIGFRCASSAVASP